MTHLRTVLSLYTVSHTSSTGLCVLVSFYPLSKLLDFFKQINKTLVYKIINITHTAYCHVADKVGFKVDILMSIIICLFISFYLKKQRLVFFVLL